MKILINVVLSIINFVILMILVRFGYKELVFPNFHGLPETLTWAQIFVIVWIPKFFTANPITFTNKRMIDKQKSFSVEDNFSYTCFLGIGFLFVILYSWILTWM